MEVKTQNVWAEEIKVDRFVVRQLLVTVGVLEVEEEDNQLWVSNKTQRWPGSKVGPLEGRLTAKIPTVQQDGARVSWIGERHQFTPEEVLDSYVDAIGFRHWDEEGSLRRPQLGALHAALGHWASGLQDPAIIVMPTGTGKTETMLALYIAGRLNRLLVIVPSDNLRNQIAEKFERLGVLQQLGIVARTAKRPSVSRLTGGISSVEDATALVGASNVIVATPAALLACEESARDALLAQASHLMVDEAHHAPAKSWASIVDAFKSKPVLLFTATPRREDGKALPGRLIFRFPLREAQKDGYFTTINHRAVLDLAGTDEAIADLALSRLDEDLEAGFDHVLMARARSIDRAEELGALYARKGQRHQPRVIHNQIGARRRKEAFKSLANRTTRVIICVDMLGEGYDLPELKIAALHDPRKSLSPAIQLVGRFTRASSQLGNATVFIPRDPSMAATPLKLLLREDADWNVLLRDLTERATQAVEEVDEFDRSFSGVPSELPLSLLAPKMSATVHRSSRSIWNPDRALSFFGEDNVLGRQLAVGLDGNVAWLVVENRGEVRWADLPDLREISYELVILYFNPDQRVLCVHGSSKTGSYKELAAAVLGEGAEIVDGARTFRVLSGLDRITPTNVGLLDARDHFARFSMYVGSDVGEAVNTPEKQGRSQTHIATTAFDDGEKVSISAALSGRIWSAQTAENLKAWVDWCRLQTPKLLDSSISLETIAAGFIIPEDVNERPPYVLLGLEWPWELYLGESAGPLVTFADVTVPLLDIEFSVDSYASEGPFLFSLSSEHWSVKYMADFTPEGGLTYSPIESDLQVTGRQPEPLRNWLNGHKPTLFLEGDRLLTGGDRLLVPQDDLAPFGKDRLTVLSWEEVSITVESQGVDQRPDSIQAYMSREMRSTSSFDVLIDDDRAGEAADLVGLKVDGSWLTVTLIHCKFSSSPTPGARLSDLYELCGQAVRGARWRRNGTVPLLKHLNRRVTDFARKNGRGPFEVGDLETLVKIREIAPQLRPRFETVLAQPGLSKEACKNEHLRLLAGAESYVAALAKGTFQVFCSP